MAVAIWYLPGRLGWQEVPFFWFCAFIRFFFFWIFTYLRQPTTQYLISVTLWLTSIGSDSIFNIWQQFLCVRAPVSSSQWTSCSIWSKWVVRWIFRELMVINQSEKYLCANHSWSVNKRSIKIVVDSRCHLEQFSRPNNFLFWSCWMIYLTHCKLPSCVFQICFTGYTDFLWFNVFRSHSFCCCIGNQFNYQKCNRRVVWKRRDQRKRGKLLYFWIQPHLCIISYMQHHFLYSFFKL